MDEPILRPLPRRPARSAPRPIRPRFQVLDAVWMLILTAAFLGFSAFSLGVSALRAPGIWLGAAATATLYALGWRTAGRAAGVIAAFFLATSRPFALGVAPGILTAAFALLTLGALLSFVAGSSLLAVALASFAALIRPDALLLALILLAFSLAQGRRRAVWATLLVLLIVIGGEAALIVFAHRPPISPRFSPNVTILRMLIAPSLAFLVWFWLPLLGELGEASKRPRWLASVAWAACFLILHALLRFTTPSAVFVSFLPTAFLLTAGGLSRLLPTLAGEFPALRYFLAVIAVVSLALMRAEWDAPAPPHPSPASAKAPSTARPR